MIEIIDANLFDLDVDIYINTVNCIGVMGKGIALQFKRKYPAMFRHYKQQCRKGNLIIGTVLPWTDPHSGKIILNLPTKYDWRNPSYVDYIVRSLNAAREWLLKRPDKTVACPALGCQNGGLSFAIVEPLIKRRWRELQNHIYLCKPRG